jgi:hypothetical protein
MESVPSLNRRWKRKQNHYLKFVNNRVKDDDDSRQTFHFKL